MVRSLAVIGVILGGISFTCTAVTVVLMSRTRIVNSAIPSSSTTKNTTTAHTISTTVGILHACFSSCKINTATATAADADDVAAQYDKVEGRKSEKNYDIVVI